MQSTESKAAPATRENYFMARNAILWLRNDLRVADNPFLGLG